MTIKERIEQAQAKMKEIQAKIKDAGETAQIAAMLTKDEIDKKVAEAKGNLAAAQENVRIATEKNQGKLNTELLKAQMTLQSAKASIEEKKEEADKDKRKKRIEELMDYAEACEAMAAQLTVEADLTMLEAAAELVEYVDKYGED